jgi:hypothetical protein
MVEKLKAISLLGTMSNVSMPSQWDAHKVFGKLQHNFWDHWIKQISCDDWFIINV